MPDSLLRLDQLLSRFGFCSRSEARHWLRAGRVTVDGQSVADPSRRVAVATVRVDGAPVEFPGGILALFHKPAAVVCSHDEGEGRRVYDLLPERWSRRNPPVQSVGRLDKDATGLLVLTDIGDWIHRWTSPRHHVPKLYEVTVDADLDPACVERFASGTLRLDGESAPCLPARLEILSAREARIEITEGRYHQVKRMFASQGAHVVRLHRTRFGPFELGALAEGEWCPGFFP
ncbi:MAG: rRNA pseudouridine synthase [Verrucomicrobia bacterium]|nr:rRNA pseudouridine synthase [Verrucomicrobiota bacterium]